MEEAARQVAVFFRESVQAVLETVARVRRYEPLVMRAASRYGVPVAVLQAIMHKESRGNPGAFNPETAGNPSRGLMQIRESTARGLGYGGAVARLFEPEVSIDLGAKLVRQLWDRYQGRVADVLADYNGGPRMVKAPGGPYGNQQYVAGGELLIRLYSLTAPAVGRLALLALALAWWWRHRK